MGCRFSVIVVGCGGTGGNFIKELGRYLYSLDQYVRDQYKLVLVDGDVVEQKNIVRQPFIEDDVGRNKAEVMSEILMEAFEITCCYYAGYVDQAEDLERFVEAGSVPVLVGCVDNHQCRQSMHRFFMGQSSCFYLDSANEYGVGEVVFGVKIGGVVLYPDRAHHFPEILEDDSVKRSEESCTSLNASSPQHLVTNLYAATILLSLAVTILTGGEFVGGVYYFDAFKGYSKQSMGRM